MSTDTQEDQNQPDIFRILVTNDNHIGFKEDDPVRQRDALVTFEEIMQIARSKNVDFVLHSGDLFDDCRPNRFWMTSVMRLLQTHCFGDNSVKFQQLKTAYSKRANFEDPNRNIDLPIYMTHGNHDDPGGEYGDSSALSTADVLDTNLLVNYFGRQDNVEEEMEIKPILLQKGHTKIALYGLGNVHEERLHRMFQAKKVKFLAPPDHDQYFNLMSIHQNRFRGSSGGVPAKNCVHNSFLPSFLNLVVWAHEHECIPSPEDSVECGFHILQSGSSVQTSLSLSEQVPKHVFLLEIAGDKFRSTPIPLLSVRPLVIDETVLPPSVSLNTPQGESLMVAKVEAMILRGMDEAKVKADARNRWLTAKVFTPMFTAASPELPLVRLRLNLLPSLTAVERQDRIGNIHILNQKFGRQFTGRLANPGDILQLVGAVKRAGTGARQSSGGGVVQLEIEDAVNATITSQPEQSVQDLIFNYMGGLQGEALLESLVEPDFNIAVQDYVHKNDAGAIDRYLKSQLDVMTKEVLDSGASDADAVHSLLRARAKQLRNERLNAAMVDANSGPPNGVVLNARPDDEDMFDDVDIDYIQDVGPAAAALAGVKRERSPSSSDFSEQEEASTARPKRGQPKPKAAPRKKAAAPALSAIPRSQVPPTANPVMAAFMTATQSQTATAKRQWARRL